MGIFPFTVLKVQGESMLPAFRPGDYIVVNRWHALFGGLKEGDVVALRDPRDASRVLVKRVSSLSTRPDLVEVIVRGDNKHSSTDSGTFGPVQRKDIIGKVLWRISR